MNWRAWELPTTTIVSAGSASPGSSCWQRVCGKSLAGSHAPEQLSGSSGHWLPRSQPSGRSCAGASVATSSVGTASSPATGGGEDGVRCSTPHQPPAAPATRATLAATATRARQGRASSQRERRTGASTARVSSQASSTAAASTANPSSRPARSWPLRCSQSTSSGQCTR